MKKKVAFRTYMGTLRARAVVLTKGDASGVAVIGTIMKSTDRGKQQRRAMLARAHVNPLAPFYQAYAEIFGENTEVTMFEPFVLSVRPANQSQNAVVEAHSKASALASILQGTGRFVVSAVVGENQIDLYLVPVQGEREQAAVLLRDMWSKIWP